MDEQKIIEAIHQLEPTDEQMQKMWMKLNSSKNTSTNKHKRKQQFLWKRRSLQLVVLGVILLLFTSISYVSLNAAAREAVKEAFQNVLGLKQSEQDIIGQAENIADSGIEIYAPEILAVDSQSLIFGNLRGLIVYDLINNEVIATIDTQEIESFYFNGDEKQTHVLKNNSKIIIFNSENGMPFGECYEYKLIIGETGCIWVDNQPVVINNQQLIQEYSDTWRGAQNKYVDTFQYFYDIELEEAMKENEKNVNYMYSEKSVKWMNDSEQEVISYIEVTDHQYTLRTYEPYANTWNNIKLDLKSVLSISENTTIAVSGNAKPSNLVMPTFQYSGADPNMKAICEYFQHNEPITMDSTALWVPAFVIYKVVEKENETLVFGNFHSYTYLKNGSVLEMLSGGEMPACIHLAEKNGKLSVSFVERAGDGSNYAKDIKNFTKGYIGLYDSFMNKSELEQDKARAEYLKMYILDNQLDIKYYKDYGWDPVKLLE